MTPSVAPPSHGDVDVSAALASLFPSLQDDDDGTYVARVEDESVVPPRPPPRAEAERTPKVADTKKSIGPAPRRPLRSVLLGAYILLNSGVVVGLGLVARNALRSRAPVTAVGEERREGHAEHGRSNDRLVETHASLNENKIELTHATEAGKMSETRRSAVEHDGTGRVQEDEHESALGARFRHMEARAAAGEIFSLDDAVALFDAKQEGPEEEHEKPAEKPAKN